MRNASLRLSEALCYIMTKNQGIKSCEKIYETNGKNLVWPVSNSGKVFNELKPK